MLTEYFESKSIKNLNRESSIFLIKEDLFNAKTEIKWMFVFVGWTNWNDTWDLSDFFQTTFL